MVIKDITNKDRKDFNTIVTHPLQSFEWGEFREKTGIKVIRKGFYKNEKIVDGFQLTIHKIPRSPWTIGYMPKGNLPTKETIEELKKIGKQEKCIFIQLEPNIEIENEKLKVENPYYNSQLSILDSQLKPAAHPLFTKFTFILDLTKSERELLQSMHPKTRYNIKVAKKHEVEIIRDNTENTFETYFKLTEETTKRQKFYAHSEKYHRLMWNTLISKNQKLDKNKLSAHSLLARYRSKENKEVILAAWVLFIFHDTLYYPYGASSNLYRETMASNLIMWEAIKFGKELGLKKFDMWGALSQNPDKNDPWYGFHRFKENYGPNLTEFIGSYDLIINPILYRFYKYADKIRWAFLKLRK